MFLAVAKQVVVDEFGAVVRVDSLEREGQGAADIVQGVDDAHLAFTHDGAGFAPSGVDVGEVQRIDEFARGVRAGVGDEVDLAGAGFVHIPMVGLDGNVVFQKSARFGAAVDAPLEPALFVLQPAVHLAWTHRAQLGLHLRRQSA